MGFSPRFLPLIAARAAGEICTVAAGAATGAETPTATLGVLLGAGAVCATDGVDGTTEETELIDKWSLLDCEWNAASDAIELSASAPLLKMSAC